MKTYDALIVGGGISGMGAAYTLYKRGLDVLVIESGAEVGGAMRSVTTPEGYVLDCGPNTLASRDPRLWAELADLGVAGRVVPASRVGKKRYILLNGRPAEIPGSPVAMLRTPLLSTSAKLRVLGEPFVPRRGADDESVAAFFARRLGPEPAARLVDPFVSGVYAGDPAALSIKAVFPALWEAEQRAGSIIRGLLGGRKKAPGAVQGPKMRSVTFSFQGGLADWPKAIARALGPARVWRRTRAVELRQAGAEWHLLVERAGGPAEAVAARAIILSTPAYAAAELVSDLDAGAAGALRGIPYAPVSVVHLGYRREQVAHPLNGFGLLAPSGERRPFLGILWASSLFPGTAPAGRALTITLVGGALAPGLALRDDQALVASAVAENEALLGARGAPEISHVTRWERAIPQYVFGHGERIAALERLERAQPGLYLTGSYRGGVGAPKAWANGVAAAEQAAAYLEQRPEPVGAV